MPLDEIAIGKILDRVRARHPSSPEVAPSFEIELINYARRAGFASLNEDELTVVLEGVAEKVIGASPSPGTAAETPLRAGDFRTTLFDLCASPFTPCEHVGIRMLRDKQHARAADRVEAELKTLEDSIRSRAEIA